MELSLVLRPVEAVVDREESDGTEEKGELVVTKTRELYQLRGGVFEKKK